MSILSQIAAFEAQSELAFGSIGSSFSAINSSGLTYPSLLLILTNLTDQTVDFSFDGTNVALTLGSGSHFVFDVTANKTDRTLYFPIGTVVYAKYRSAATTSGFVALSSCYSKS